MTTFIRLLEMEDKTTALARIVEEERTGTQSASVFKVPSESFAQVPGSTFAYWVSEQIRRLFKTLPPFDGEGRTVKQGLATADDFRFVRAWWEAPADSIGQQWFPFAKGGAFSPFYSDVYLVVNWTNDGAEIVNFVDFKTGKAYSRPQNTEYYFRPGLTWPLRTQSGLAFRSMPAGCIFGHKGPAAFVENDNAEALLALLAITNSQAFRSMVELQMAFGSYEVGVIQRTPVPALPDVNRHVLAEIARRAWSLKRGLDTADPTSHAFTLPALLQMTGGVVAERAEAWSTRVRETESSLADIQRQIDLLCFDLYGFAPEDRTAFSNAAGSSTQTYEEAEAEQEVEAASVSGDALNLAVDLFDWLVGTAFGRFDVRLATGKRRPSIEPEPFGPFPVCSLGILTDGHGLLAKHPVEDYPMSWPEDGILVDDPGIGGLAADRDIMRRVRQLINVVWGEKAGEIDQELCTLLGVRELRDYLRKPAFFFDSHLRRYSKSRRKAPIYWPLSIASGDYTVWVYYPRLTADTLYKIATEHVGPKISKVEDRIAQLEGEQAKREGREVARAAKDHAELTELLGELKELRDELLRMAKLPYKPDLNDGVQITAAPLWRLFRLPRWRTELENTWKALERGDYDWAHLAYAIRPEHVKNKCKTDKSLAIAHGLEQIYEKNTNTGSATGTKTKKIRTTKSTNSTKKAGTRKVRGKR